MSPRRSSRARTTHPLNPPTHTNSSTSTTSLNGGERSTRSNNRQASPRDASIQRSQSLDDADSAAPTEPLAPRRSRRGTEQEKDSNVKQHENDEELGGTDEEVTRCICGQAEYPGPPVSIRDQKPAEDQAPEDVGNFFIQCDNCHVWQHAGCMGLADESLAPEEYYCEKCRPQCHQIIRGINGPDSSVYQPGTKFRSSRSSSLLSSGENSSKKGDKERQNSASIKRRATMNSRGAYDEDEALRKAIEESREMGTLGKRTREEDEDTKPNTKRQRTNSSSPSSLSKQSRSPSQALDEEDGPRNTTNGGYIAHKSRSAIARSHREKEMRERQREEAAAQRAEAANKRAARSERRRGDESPPPTPSLSPSRVVQPSKKTSGNGNDPSPSHKSNINNLRKTGRPTARRGRLGRNQYTRDLPVNGDMSDTPLRDTSHDPNGNSRSPTSGGANGINGESGRSSKAKTHPARTSMNEMKRRVAAILEFVGHMQTERTPSQQTSGTGSEKGGSTPNGLDVGSLPTANLVRAIEAGLRDAADGESSSSNGEVMGESASREFGTMGSAEMMEMLTRELVSWQVVYGKYGEK